MTPEQIGIRELKKKIAQWNTSLEALKLSGCRTKGYSSLEDAKRVITNYITGYYSRVRPHQYTYLPSEEELRKELQRERLLITSQ